MEEELSGSSTSRKPATALVRGRHDLFNMKLTGSERVLAVVVGNAFAGRLGPKAQEKMLDVVLTEMTQKPKRDEILTAVKAAGLEYNIDDGLKRQRVRDEAVAHSRG